MQWLSTLMSGGVGIANTTASDAIETIGGGIASNVKTVAVKSTYYIVGIGIVVLVLVTATKTTVNKVLS